jgi:hypothetical protein
MRTAPSFRLQAPTSVGWRRVLLGTWLATAALVLAWLLAAWLRHDLDTPKVITAGLAAAVWLLARPTPPPACIDLTWDGQGWQWLDLQSAASAPKPCDVHAAVDLGAWLLLRLIPFTPGPVWQRRVHWVALSESDSGATWHSVRCALYSARRMIDPAPSPMTPPSDEVRPPPR